MAQGLAQQQLPRLQIATMSIVVQAKARESPPEELLTYEGAGPWFTCDADGEILPHPAKAGYAGPKTTVSTVPKLLQEAAQKKGDKDALLVERPLPPLGEGNKAPPPLPREKWTTWTIKQYHDDVRNLAKAFIKLGFQPFDTVNVWGFNAPEWFIGAIAGMYAGGKNGGLYPTDTPDIAAYKVVHSSGSIIIVDEMSKVKKLVEGMANRVTEKQQPCTKLKAVICWGDDPKEGEKVNIPGGIGDIPLLGMKAALKMGQDSGLDEEVDKRVEAVKPGHCATLIYTSGTTGDPKAVMISHDNIVYEATVSFGVVGESCGYGATAAEERICSYLPLSHVAGTMMDLVSQIQIAATRPSYLAVFFARPYDLKAGTIKDRLSIAKPTAFLGVPLVWEKMADKIRAIGAAASPTQAKVGAWAKAQALDYARSIQVGGTPVTSCTFGCAMSILSKVKAGVGLDCCKYALTGAAPVRVDTLEYFGSLGIYINELYGMSECTGACTGSTDQCHQWGSVGWAFPGCEVVAFKVSDKDLNEKTKCERAPKLDSMEDKYQGELCFRGRNIMMGYLACKEMPGQKEEITKKTAETIDSSGWLHSGDKGLVTVLGMTKITGRYKELIIGAGGENIAPVPIEDSIKKYCDGIMEVMMVGDQRKYNVALITLKAQGANGDTPGTNDLDAGAKKLNPKISTISEAMQDEIVVEAVKQAIDKTNGDSKVVANQAFKIAKFSILPHNFSEERGELTPTKKMKRKAVETNFKWLIDDMYATEGSGFLSYKAMWEKLPATAGIPFSAFSPKP